MARRKKFTSGSLSVRLDDAQANLVKWKNTIDTDYDAVGKYSDFSYEDMLRSCGYDQALDQVKKAKRELDKNNLIGAEYFLSTAESAPFLKKVNEANFNEFVSMAEQGIKHRKGQILGGQENATRRREDDKPANKSLLADAKKLMKEHPSWSVSRVGRAIAERIGSNHDVVRKKLARLLKE
jgi:hypothetical protein